MSKSKKLTLDEAVNIICNMPDLVDLTGMEPCYMDEFLIEIEKPKNRKYKHALDFLSLIGCGHDVLVLVKTKARINHGLSNLNANELEQKFMFTASMAHLSFLTEKGIN